MISLSILLFLSWSSPWENAVEATAPWISKDRENSRIEFFDGLGQKAESLSALTMNRVDRLEPAVPRPRLAGDSDDESRGDHELKEIPWAAHRTLYPQLAQRGLWTWPVDKARVISGFGLRGGRPHEGLDLRAPYGTRVNSAAAGRVVFAGTLRGYGKTLVVYHGEGWSTVYAHLSAFSTSRGRLVERGDAVGLSGDSGKASGPHLHFEVRRDGRPHNPLSLSFSATPYLSSRKR